MIGQIKPKAPAFQVTFFTSIQHLRCASPAVLHRLRFRFDLLPGL